MTSQSGCLFLRVDFNTIWECVGNAGPQMTNGQVLNGRLLRLLMQFHKLNTVSIYSEGGYCYEGAWGLMLNIDDLF